MKTSGSMSEFSAAVTGQAVGSLLTYETFVGWQVRGASWLVRGLKGAFQQAGVAGIADFATQKNLIAAGEQDKVDWRRTVEATASSFVSGAVTSSVGKGGKAQNDSLGITPEGPPKPHTPAPDAKAATLEPAALKPVAADAVPHDVVPETVALRADADNVVPNDVPGSPVAKGEAMPSVTAAPEVQAASRHDAPAKSSAGEQTAC